MNYKLILFLLLLFIFFLIMCGIIATHVEFENEDNYIYLDLNLTWFNETILVKNENFKCNNHKAKRNYKAK